MTDLPLGADGFLRMEAFSDADIDEPEIASVEYADPEPMSESAWTRAVASAVGGEQASPDDAEPLLEPGDAALGSDGLEPLDAHDDDLDDGDLDDDLLDGWYPADGETGADGPDHAAPVDHAGGAGDDAPTGET
jgi:hypothetical protein